MSDHWNHAIDALAFCLKASLQGAVGPLTEEEPAALRTLAETALRILPKAAADPSASAKGEAELNLQVARILGRRVIEHHEALSMILSSLASNGASVLVEFMVRMNLPLPPPGR